ncbi:hypothetical protein LTR84_011841 [Exophiala bonariae]|uniref:Nucleoside phosphorylase domain-containing protein n=1 Tax=Exophiala bonariae TaxID=1690606 RepID=A0AAV9NH43_9EURO|nr:hypothetical protein LTR84_011841 [Exophiala bonariae]
MSTPFRPEKNPDTHNIWPSSSPQTQPAIRPPRDRSDFRIILICALPLEAESVQATFDHCWDDEGKRYGKASGDPNEYTTGMIGEHNVVLAHMPGMGTTSAAAVSAARVSFPSIVLAIVVGICGAAPFGNNHQEILLGDVVISKALVQYDFGRQHPGGFERKTDVQASIGRPSPELRAIQARLATTQHKQRMRRNLTRYLQEIQQTLPGTVCPGREYDVLYRSSYIHQHHPSANCQKCSEVGEICEVALHANCDDLGCQANMREERKRMAGPSTIDPEIHFGIVASGNAVIRSGEYRDQLVKAEGVIGFEMEGVGVWDYFPTIIIKGVCDYADSHKQKGWQSYAAAAAAACTKAFLKEWDAASTVKERDVASHQKFHWLVPFERNRDFVDRTSIMDELLHLIPPEMEMDCCQRTVIEGLGGTGKTQIALEAAFRIRDQYPSCSIFWVPTVDMTSLENAYREIGRKLLVPGLEESGADVKFLVKNAMSDGGCGTWLLIVDNADDVELLFRSNSLGDYLPSSPLGSILFTTRNHEVAAELDIPSRNVIAAGELSDTEAIQLLQTNLKKTQLGDNKSTKALLKLLTNLPLAIKQASAYMARTSMSVNKYLLHCQAGDERLIRLLSHQTEYKGRYKGMNSAIASTWLISFTQVQRDKPLAARILRGICFFVEKDIPYSLCLDRKDELEFDEAIGVLKAYAFVSEREDGYSFDIHRLVQLAMRSWLQEEKEQEYWMKQTVQQLSKRCPYPTQANKNLWQRYLPHILSALQFYEKKIGDLLGIEVLVGVAQFYGIVGNYAEQESICRHFLQMGKTPQESNSEVLLDVKHLLGQALLDQGKYVEARQIFGETVDQERSLFGEEDRKTLSSTIRFAEALHFCGEPVEAEKILRKTLSRCEALFGKSDSYTLRCMRRLGEQLYFQRRYEESEKMIRDALSQVGSVPRDDLSGLSVTRTLLQLGQSLEGLRRFEEAEKLFREGVDRYEMVLGERHPETLTAKLSLAQVCRDQGKYREAEQLYRNQIPLLRDLYGDEHRRTLRAISGLAGTLRELEEYQESADLYREELRLCKMIYGENHKAKPWARHGLIYVLKKQAKLEEAEQIYSEMDADTRTAYDHRFSRSSGS